MPATAAPGVVGVPSASQTRTAVRTQSLPVASLQRRRRTDTETNFRSAASPLVAPPRGGHKETSVVQTNSLPQRYVPDVPWTFHVACTELEDGAPNSVPRRLATG